MADTVRMRSPPRRSCAVASCAQVVWYGTCTPQPPSSSTGAMSERSELPTIRKRSGAMPNSSNNRAYVAASFSLTISMRRNRSARPLSRTFCSWWNRSPLVISTTGCSAATASTAERTPSSTSTGCRSRPLARATMRCTSAPLMRASVISTAASIIDSVMPFTP